MLRRLEVMRLGKWQKGGQDAAGKAAKGGQDAVKQGRWVFERCWGALSQVGCLVGAVSSKVEKMRGDWKVVSRIR